MPREKHMARKSTRRVVGESSSRQAQPEFDESRFLTKEREKWYNERISNRMVVEKTISLDIDREFLLKALFRVLGWQHVCELRGAYYPELVKQFYANLDRSEDDHSCFRSMVKGVAISMTERSVAELLHCPTDGAMVQIWRSRNQYDWRWKKEEAMDRLGLYFETQHGRQMVPVRLLEVRHRLIAYLLGFNVEPRSSGLNELRVTDIYVIDKMVNGLGEIGGLQLVPIIFKSIWDGHHMQKKDKNFVFPILISKILERHGVNFDNEQVLHSTARDEVTEATLIDLRFKKVRGTWVSMGRQEREQREEQEEEEEDGGDGDQHEEEAAAPEQPQQSDPSIVARLDILDEQMGTMNTRMANMEQMIQQLLHYHQYPHPPPM